MVTGLPSTMNVDYCARAIRSIRRPLLVAAFATLTTAPGHCEIAPGNLAGVVWAPKHDARIILPVQPFLDAIAGFANAKYEGQFRIAGRTCDIDLNITNAKASTMGSMDLIDGATAFQLQADIAPKGDGNDICTNINVGGVCSATAQVGDISFEGSGAGECVITIGIGKDSTSTYSFPIHIDPLITVGSKFDVKLKPGDEVLRLEFGELVDGAFVSSSTPLVRTVAISGRLGGLLGTHGPISEISPLLQVIESPSLVAADVTFGSPHAVPYANIDAAVQAVQPSIQVPTNQAALEISSSLFGQLSTVQDADGLFGSLLPIRVSGSQPLSKKYTAIYEFVISQARAGLGIEKGTGVVGLELTLFEPHVWLSTDGTTKGVEFQLSNILALGKIEAPSIKSDGAVKSVLRELGFRFTLKSPSFSGKLDIRGLSNAIDLGQFEIAKVHGDIKIGIPDCILLDNDNFTPKRSCLETHPGRPGALSNSTPEKSRTIKLRFDQVSKPIVDRNKTSLWYLIPIESD